MTGAGMGLTAAVLAAFLVVQPAAAQQDETGGEETGNGAASETARESGGRPGVAALKTRAATGDREAAWKALKALRQRARNGNTDAAMALGALYETGAPAGVSANAAQAFDWYQRAGEADRGRAQLKVARMARNGEGVAMDSALAREWFGRAARNDVPAAMAAYGIMLLDGTGGPQQFHEATQWLVRAANRGRGGAQARLDTLYWQGTYDFREAMLPEAGRATGAAAGRLRDNLDYLLAPFADPDKQGVRLTWKGDRVVAPAPGREGWLMAILPLATLRPAGEDAAGPKIRLGTLRLFAREKRLGVYAVRLAVPHKWRLLDRHGERISTLTVADQMLRGTFSLPLSTFTHLDARVKDAALRWNGGAWHARAGTAGITHDLVEGESDRWSGRMRWRFRDVAVASGSPRPWRVRIGRLERTLAVTDLRLGFYSRLLRVLGVDQRTGGLDRERFLAGTRLLPETLPTPMRAFGLDYSAADIRLRPSGKTGAEAGIIEEIHLNLGGGGLETDDARLSAGLSLTRGRLPENLDLPDRLRAVYPKRLEATAAAVDVPARKLLDSALEAFMGALEAAGEEARDAGDAGTDRIMPAVETFTDTVRDALDEGGSTVALETVRLDAGATTAEVRGTVRPDRDAAYGVTAELTLRLKGADALRRALAGGAGAEAPGWLSKEMEAWRAKYGKPDSGGESGPAGGSPAAVRAAFDRLRDVGRAVLAPDGTRWVEYTIALRADGAVRVNDRPVAALRADITTLREQTPLPPLSIEEGGWAPVETGGS